MTPAPKDISPCVSVGPSSITSTFFPLISAAFSTAIGERASTIRAPGLMRRTFAMTASTLTRSAESTLFTTTTSASRTFVSPG